MKEEHLDDGSSEDGRYVHEDPPERQLLSVGEPGDEVGHQ